MDSFQPTFEDVPQPQVELRQHECNHGSWFCLHLPLFFSFTLARPKTAAVCPVPLGPEVNGLPPHLLFFGGILSGGTIGLRS